MKHLRYLILILLPLTTWAGYVVWFDPVTKRVTGAAGSVDSSLWVGKSNALINPIVPAGFPSNGWNSYYVTNGAVSNVPQSVLDAEALAAWTAASNAQVLAVWTYRSNCMVEASLLMNATNAEGRILRAFALLTLDQINTLRKQASLPIITTNTFLTAMTNAVMADPR